MSSGPMAEIGMVPGAMIAVPPKNRMAGIRTR